MDLFHGYVVIVLITFLLVWFFNGLFGESLDDFDDYGNFIICDIFISLLWLPAIFCFIGYFLYKLGRKFKKEY